MSTQPVTPPATTCATSFLSLSPTPPRTRPLPARLLSPLAPAAAAANSPLSPAPPPSTAASSRRSFEEFDFERDDLSLRSNNPFRAILLAQRCATSTPTSSPRLAPPSPDTSVASSQPTCNDDDDDDGTDSVVFEGSFSSLLDGLVDETRRTGLSIDDDLAPTTDEWEDSPPPSSSSDEPPVTPTLSLPPSSPDHTPRAGHRVRASPRRRRNRSSVTTTTTAAASSPRQYHRHKHRRRGSTTPRSPPGGASRRASVQGGGGGRGFRYCPTSPLEYPLVPSTAQPGSSSPRRRHVDTSPPRASTLTTGPKKKKNKEKKQPPQVKKHARPPLAPFDAEALDLFFGVTKSVAKARKGGYESIARRTGVLDGDHDERGRQDGFAGWRRVEEFRALLDPTSVVSVDESDQEEDEADEILHIRNPGGSAPFLDDDDLSSSRSGSPLPVTTTTELPSPPPPRRRRHRPRPPPLELSHSNNSSASSSFSPDTPPDPLHSPTRSNRLGSPVSLCSPPSRPEPDPLSLEILHRTTRRRGPPPPSEQHASTSLRSRLDAPTLEGRAEKSRFKDVVGDKWRQFCRF
ncbi:hypothetical protein JCM11491_003258 [Sporobolomyces phaffii]